MSDNFLSRWSRRKLEAKAEKPADQKAEGINQTIGPGQLATAQLPASDKQHPELVRPSVSKPDAAVIPLPTDADLTAVEQGGDIKAFLVDKVSTELKNKAFRALFSRPEFNVMDGLDIYIDDYNKFTPLSAADIEKMTFSKQLLSRPDLELPTLSDAKDTVATLSSAAEPLKPDQNTVLDNSLAADFEASVLIEGDNSVRVNPDDLQVTEKSMKETDHLIEKSNPESN